MYFCIKYNYIKVLLVLNRMLVEGICGHKCNINSPENPFDKNRILCDLRWPWIKSPSHRSMSNVLSIMSRVVAMHL